MLKDFLGLGWEQAIEEAKAQGRDYKIHKGDECDYDWIEVTTSEGNGAALEFDGEDTVQEYVYLDW